MPKPFSEEFRDDVVAGAMNRDSTTTLRQIAADFGVSESGLAKWVKTAEIESGSKSGLTIAE